MGFLLCLDAALLDETFGPVVSSAREVDSIIVRRVAQPLRLTAKRRHTANRSCGLPSPRTLSFATLRRRCGAALRCAAA
eukprot:6182568-Pleurochrysis_carterae.AAC.3